MTHICERIVVCCPGLEASDCLAAFVADHRDTDGFVKMLLRTSISKVSDRRPISKRPVFVTFRSLKSLEDYSPTYSVSWLPKGDGVSPEFVGALAVVQLARDDFFSLVLTGNLATVVKVDKGNLGRRIAQISPHAVLHFIAHYVENIYAHNQAAMASHRSATFMPAPILQSMA